MSYKYPTVVLNTNQVAIFRSAITSLTDEGIQDSVGVSWNTWRRISKGQPIKVSTFDRIKRRLHAKGIEL